MRVYDRKLGMDGGVSEGEVWSSRRRLGSLPGDEGEEDQGNENGAEKGRQSTGDNQYYQCLALALELSRGKKEGRRPVG